MTIVNMEQSGQPESAEASNVCKVARSSSEFSLFFDHNFVAIRAHLS